MDEKKTSREVSRTTVRAFSLMREGKFLAAVHLLERQPLSPNRREDSDALCCLADALQRTGRGERAAALARRLMSSVGTSRSTEGKCLLVLGSVSRDAGALTEAATYLQRACALADEQRDVETACWARLRMMMALAELSGPEAALGQLDETRKAVARAGSRDAMAALHVFLAEMETKRGLFDEARSHLRRAETLLRKSRNTWLEGLWCIASMCVSFLNSDLERALREAVRALDCARASGHTVTRMAATSNIGHVYLATGDYDKAEQWLQRASSAWTQGGGGKIAILDGLAQVALARRNFDECDSLLASVEAIAGPTSETPSYYHLCTFQTRARLMMRQGRWSEANSFLRRALPAAVAASIPAIHNLLRLLHAEVLLTLGHENEAARLIDQVASSHEGLSVEVLAEIARVAGKALAHTGALPAAIAQFERAAGILASVGNLQARAEILQTYCDTLWPAVRKTDTPAQPAPSTFVTPTRPRRLALVPDAATSLAHLPPPTAATAVGRAAALINLAAYPEILGQEAFALIRDARSPAAIVLTARAPSGRRTIITHANCDFPHACTIASSTEDTIRINLGTWHNKVYELVISQPSAIEALLTLRAVEQLIDAALRLEQVRREAREKTALWPVEPPDDTGGAVFISRQMTEIANIARRVAPTHVNILLTGETGTGKEVIARIIHRNSSRADKPFVPFNCHAVPHEMLDSQLFGHRRGAFTGAHSDFPGVIRAAAGGTLFLDEIGDLSLEVQPKLLRFIDTGEILPIGESRPTTVDVRIIAATNANLRKLVKEGRFREDLFFRLDVIHLHLPPLRERREEIPPLVDHFLERYGRELGKTHLRVAEDTMEHLLLYRWPGNVRELANEMHRLAALAEDGAILMPEHLKDEVTAGRLTIPATARPPAPNEVLVRLDQPLAAATEHLERAMLKHALAASHGRLEPAARALGLSRKGLYLKRQRLGLDAAAAS